MRIKSRWHKKDKPKSVEEIAGALAFIAWRIASTTVNAMYSKGFDFSSNKQQLDVIAEFLAFLIQAADRLSYEPMEADERQRFISTLALKLADTLADNRNEEQGEGDHRGDFIQLLNERLEAYSEFNFPDDEPGYHSLRFLGERIDAVMGGDENKWVIEQVVDIEAPELFKTFRKGMNDLFE